MAQVDEIYNFLIDNYELNTPIFCSDLDILGMKQSSICQQLKKLTEDGRLKCFDAGIYYLPKKSIFRSGSTLSIDEVIRKKYLIEGGLRCGYISGIMFANQLGLTTQGSSMYEIYTNKATTNYKLVLLASFRVIIRKPCYIINEQNASTLQFLDLLKNVVDISEIEGAKLKKRLFCYMMKKGISFDSMKPYLRYYPKSIYRNMYEVGLMNGVSA